MKFATAVLLGLTSAIQINETPANVKDVKNEHINPDVYEVVNEMVEPTAEIPRKASAPVTKNESNKTNGTLASLKMKEVPSEKKDVNNKEIRPDVYHVVNDIVSSTNEIPRSANAPPAVKNDSNNNFKTIV